MSLSGLPTPVRYGIFGGIVGGVISVLVRAAFRHPVITLGIGLLVWWQDVSSGNPDRRRILAGYSSKQVTMAVDRVVTEPWYTRDYVIEAVEARVINRSVARVRVQSAWCHYRNEYREEHTLWTYPVSAEIEPGASAQMRFEMPHLLKNATDITCSPVVQPDENDLFRRAGRPDLVRDWVRP